MKFGGFVPLGQRGWYGGDVKGAVIAFGAAIVMFATAGAAAAAVTPTTCTTLATDVNSASAAEVLQLPAGSCKTNVTVTNTNAFTLKGASGGGTVLEPQTSGPIIGSVENDVRFTLSGLEFTGEDGDSALDLDGGNSGLGVTIKDDVFADDDAGAGAGGAINMTSNASSQPIVITGDTFAGDSAGATGGAVYWDGGQPLVLTGNTFTGDSSNIWGGGLLVVDFGPTNSNPVQISGNTFGGASASAGDTARGLGGGALVFLAPGQALTLTGNKFEKDRITGSSTATGPREGGGLWLGLPFGGTPYRVTQAHNVFSDNVIDETEAPAQTDLAAGGAGEWISGLAVQSTADTFTGNRVAVDDGAPPEGGAVGAIATEAEGATPSEPAAFVGRDDLFSGNSTPRGGWGGAIYVGNPSPDCTGTCPGSSVTLEDSTVIDNSVDAGAGSEGGAIWGSPNDKLTGTNSILYGNGPRPEIFGFASTRPAFRYSDVCTEAGGPTLSGTGNICADPKLTATGVETLASPTLDAGSNALIPAGLTTDLAGRPRIAASHVTCTGVGPALVDMGAFESTLRTVPSCSAKVKIAGAALVVANGKTNVRLSCPTHIDYCDGTVTLITVRSFPTANKHKHKREPLTLGAGHFHILGGKTKQVTIKLSNKALTELAKLSSVRITITVSDHDGFHHRATSHRSLNLRLPG